MTREVIQERVTVMDLNRSHIGKLVQFQTEEVNVVGKLDRVDHRQEAYLEHGETWWDLKPVRLILDTTLVISGWRAVVDPRAQVLAETLDALRRSARPVLLVAEEDVAVVDDPLRQNRSDAGKRVELRSGQVTLPQVVVRFDQFEFRDTRQEAPKLRKRIGPKSQLLG